MGIKKLEFLPPAERVPDERLFMTIGRLITFYFLFPVSRATQLVFVHHHPLLKLQALQTLFYGLFLMHKYREYVELMVARKPV